METEKSASSYLLIIFIDGGVLLNQREISNDGQGLGFSIKSIEHAIDHEKYSGCDNGNGDDGGQKHAKPTQCSNAGRDAVINQFFVENCADDQMEQPGSKP